MIPDDELIPKSSISFAPMVDFLFIVIAIFAVIAISRKALLDSKLSLATISSKQTSSSHHPDKTANLIISPRGDYQLIHAQKKLHLKDIEAIKKELHILQTTDILLHIDKETHWEPIVTLIHAMNEEGFHVYPVYEKK